MPAPFAPIHLQQPLPALYLYPLNESFIPKHIHLPPSQRVKIGRQTNAKTAPGERNGFFDSKVLSRQHAEVWEEAGKIFIKDVKSSNGTFINGERLSAEGAESEPFELKTDDIVEFGIDIVGEDNKTIIHHKVAARVVCVLTEQDAQAAARIEQHQNVPTMHRLSTQPGSTANNTAFNFANAQGAPGQTQRRPAMQQPGVIEMSDRGGNMRPPGKSGLSFEHILSRLQGELQKTRETGAELHSLTGAMNEIHETLSGNLPQNLVPYPQTVPSVQSSQPAPPADSTTGAGPSSSTSLADLQSQLQETQASLASHVDKIRALEGMLAEHEAIKREVSALRELMEEEKRELDLVRGRRRSGTLRADDHEDIDFGADDDDARSIATVTPHELERVEEEDELQMAAEEEEEEYRRRREELGRPRTPEPTGMGMDDEDLHNQSKIHLQVRSRSPSPLRMDQHQPVSSSAVSEERLNALSTQLESALELSRTLQAQHAAAQNTISMLESKVSSLESLVETSQTQIQSHAAEAVQDRASITTLITEWKKGVEGQWNGVREEWAQERARVGKAREEWEARVHAVEEGMSGSVAKVEASLAIMQQYQVKQNGSARNGVGLVTPPSPRSISSNSGKRRKRSASSRGRSRSHSIGSKDDGDCTSSSEGMTFMDEKPPLDQLLPRPSASPRSRHHTPWLHDDSDLDAHVIGDMDSKGRVSLAGQYPISPGSSIREASTGSTTTMTTEDDAGAHNPDTIVHSKGRHLDPMGSHFTQVSTAVGVLILGVAAAAVLWRVKTE
ncbi:hypothetical protein EW146_g3966 [Bondarzewia mesenterica]|uniref:FHA domain-containing protein n=1 Tax=Bondarzewia mesenterica TaxID=1095465 RepID=A0A4S4LWG5_9AGAM|nr:hypothetical protein EW146_g3966 [Bondarzewia mesenterica]